MKKVFLLAILILVFSQSSLKAQQLNRDSLSSQHRIEKEKRKADRLSQKANKKHKKMERKERKMKRKEKKERKREKRVRKEQKRLKDHTGLTEGRLSNIA